MPPVLWGRKVSDRLWVHAHRKRVWKCYTQRPSFLSGFVTVCSCVPVVCFNSWQSRDGRSAAKENSTAARGASQGRQQGHRPTSRVQQGQWPLSSTMRWAPHACATAGGGDCEGEAADKQPHYSAVRPKLQQHLMALEKQQVQVIQKKKAAGQGLEPGSCR